MIVTMPFGWLVVLCALVFAATIWIFGYFMGKRLDKLHNQVKDMTREVDEMSRMLDDNEKILDLNRKIREDDFRVDPFRK